MQNITTITSDVSGLWSRMLIKIVGYWVGGLWFMRIILPLVPPSALYILLLGALAIVVYYSVSVLKNHPLKWKKTITFDFDNKIISIISGDRYRSQQDILDESARKIEFSDIQELQAKTYDSFLSSSYYQISLLLKSGKTIKLLALKSPNVYTELLSKFKKAGLPLS